MKPITIIMVSLLIGLLVAPGLAVSSGDDIGHAQLYESKYVDNNPSLYEVFPVNAYGYVIFYIRGVTVQDRMIFISSDDHQKDLVMDNAFRPDKSNITDQNKEMLLVEILTDGVSKPVLLSAGNYTAHLRQGNGDQPESQKFVIGGGATERVVFLGAAIPTMHKEICEVFTILDKAGYIIHHDEVNHTVHHEAITHIEIVVDTPAWDETIVDKEAWDETVVDTEPWDELIYHPEVNHTVHHDAITHEETVIDQEAWDETIIDIPAHAEYRTVTHEEYYVHDWKYFNGVGWKVKCTNHAEHGEGWHAQTADCTKSYNIYGEWTDTKPHYGCDYETRTVPAVTHIIHHPAVTHQEIVVDTPAWDEIVVDVPAWIETIHHEEETHVVHHDAITHIVHHEAITHEITVTDKEPWDEIVVDVPAWDEQVGAITHKETVCNKYGNPVPPVGTIPQTF